MDKQLYICEVCGKEEMLTPDEAFNEGWDYPPFIGEFGAVSPRTCPDCPMEKTAWAALVLEKKTYPELTDRQKATIQRIMKEGK